ncbi:hypothetical protein D3C85_1519280 [compost metagenome]
MTIAVLGLDPPALADDVRLAAGVVVAQVLVVLDGSAHGHQPADVGAEQLVALVAEQAQGEVVDLEDMPLAVDAHDAGGGAAHDGLVAGGALLAAQALLVEQLAVVVQFD